MVAARADRGRLPLVFSVEETLQEDRHLDQGTSRSHQDPCLRRFILILVGSDHILVHQELHQQQMMVELVQREDVLADLLIVQRQLSAARVHLNVQTILVELDHLVLAVEDYLASTCWAEKLTISH